MSGDHELYRRFLAGESEAFDALITKYSGRLILYLSGMTQNVQDAEDLAIETFAAILARRPAIRPGGFQAYLYRAARNRAIRFHGRLVRRRAFQLEEDQAQALLAVRPDDAFLRGERCRSVRRCLGRIEPGPREALWLVYCEEMSYAQAAAIMGVDPKKIDNLLTKGKRLMRLELEKEGIAGADE
ncbi:MAG: RNA polymerase sigma factor [Clostridia bacterium]|nr:RNA polymerase sigma factor [Clostridia bacterium]